MDTSCPSPSTQHELEEFRKQWQREVQDRKVSRKTTTAPSKSAESALVQQTESLSLGEESEVQTDAEKPKELETAMDHYIEAVDNERQGKLGQAINYYRRAFKLNPDVDMDYKHHYQTHIAPTINEPKSTGDNGEDDDAFHHVVPIGNEYIAPSAIRDDPLADLIQQFTDEDLQYIPAIDYKPVWIAKLPNEILVHVLRQLILRSVSSVANFALVCKNFFLLTRSPSLWRFVCEHAFQTPGMTLEESRRHQSESVLVYGGHWMRMFIERPRLRYDGVYISTCNYIRMGTSDTWNQPVHLVTYYRYLRFFPNGRILKHVTTDEPADVVKLLRPNYKKRQIFLGQFDIEGDQIVVEMQDRVLPREHFRMSLAIKSTHRGRHNKLAWQEYISVTDGREDVIHTYDLKLMKPYFFSVVRSYSIDLPSGETLVHNSVQNAHGELLCVVASVLDVDSTEKTYKIHFTVQPNGTLANEYGQLKQEIAISFSSLKSYIFQAGNAVNPIALKFSYDFGNEIDYPFDEYIGYIELFASYSNESHHSIPVDLKLEASISSFIFHPAFTPMPSHSNRIGIKIVTRRSTTTWIFSIFVCLLMWALTLIMGLYGYQVGMKRRKVDAHACMIGLTMLFALPALRSTQPGVPQVGCTSDILGFYWNMAIIALATLGIILCWVVRWDSTLGIDYEHGEISDDDDSTKHDGEVHHIENVSTVQNYDDSNRSSIVTHVMVEHTSNQIH
ncbi:hypothetical protein DFQ30_004647 [Apophysomyces sp. BC1015]|nr:hypothetical protein DFQ30_004647 [Apophysomyces sp. BC1015]KAG0177250.1 hypothetical protein DFQ29_005069 [Apophysomyces sp. BC1021]